MIRDQRKGDGHLHNLSGVFGVSSEQEVISPLAASQIEVEQSSFVKSEVLNASEPRTVQVVQEPEEDVSPLAGCCTIA